MTFLVIRASSLFHHSSFLLRHYLATLIERRYRRNMKTARCFPAILLVTAMSIFAADKPKEKLKPALDAITPDGLLAQIKILASDEFEGRAPGTKGEELSIKYISDQFKAIGLKPGNPDGSYTQEVPLTGIKSDPKMSFTIAGNTTELRYPDDYVASSARLQNEIKIDNSDVVFVGYGIVAPEYGWDDYKDVDVRGKTILMLINDPPIPDPKDPSKLDEKMFKGKAMTYYGRWTYKYEIATQKGAAAAVIIHETEPAAYPYSVVKSSWGKENFELDAPDKNKDAVQARSWITLDVAKKLLADCGQDFAALKKSAISKDFRPVALNAKAKIEIKQTLRSFKSHNVIGKLEGSDPKLKDEYIIYTAHWDHLGRHPELQGDQIFNGAVDNASGDAAVIELARAFSKLNPPPRRSVLFMCTTAEEAGLLGAKFYTQRPLYPLEKTLADLNVDSMNVWGKARDIEDVSFGMSTLDDMLADAAKRQGRVAIPNGRPEKGKIYRADNFEFSKVGLPSLYIGNGEHLLSRPADAPLRSDEFDLHDYHQVTDEVKPDWDLTGAVQDVDLLFEVGYQIANGAKFPEWKPGVEFKPKRDAMMKSAGG
jgi:Zn-dependent M28 family amino/carboxypeptidase